MSDRGGDLLPPEIWFDILTNLPVKSILRCRSVCKSWYSLISSPDFISKFQTLNNTDKHIVLELRNNRTNVPSFRSFDESFTEYHELDFEFDRGRDLDYVIVGSSNGLVCLKRWDRGAVLDDPNGVSTLTFLIWNPCIRKLVELPNSITYSYRTHNCSLDGFGFDLRSSEYKVLSVVCMNPFEDPDRRKLGRRRISDLRRFGVWRDIDISPTNVWDWDVEGRQCDLNGTLHWSAWGGNGGLEGRYRVVLSFDLSDEVFREIRMPSCEEFTRARASVNVLECHGLIHVSVCRKMVGWEYPFPTPGRCSVWAMKEYGVTESWTKLFNVDTSRFRACKFWFWENGEVLGRVRGHNHEVDEHNGEDFPLKDDLVLYDPKIRNTKCLFSIDQSILDVRFYTESLVLL